MKQTEFSWKTGEGGAIYAVEWRPEGTAKAVVALVHGLGEHLHRYDHLAEAYGKAGIGIVALDLPGHGRSEGKRGHASYALIMDQIDRLLEEARSRFPGLPVFLYGHSLGGSLVLTYLIARKPGLAGAVVTAPGLATTTPVAPAKVLVAKLMSGILPSLTLANGLDVTAISRDPKEVQRYRDDPLITDQVSARLGNDLLQAGPNVMAAAAEIGLPLLLVQGSADRIADPATNERFARSVPGATLKVFEGGYHELQNDPCKAEFFAFVLDWIGRHAK
jgi:alpha-beta hydrolase superfamily lysophospholipase